LDQADEWKTVLAEFADALHKAEKSKSTRSTDLVDEFSDVLFHLSAAFEPETFLNLLPRNGRMAFFLPFIEISFSRHTARTKTDILLSAAENKLSSVS